MSGDRILTLFTMLASQVAGLGVFFFWAIAAVLSFNAVSGGQMTYLDLGAMPRLLFLSYPVVLIGASLVAWLAFWRRKDLLATAMIAAPVGLVVLYYIYLVNFRGTFS